MAEDSASLGLLNQFLHLKILALKILVFFPLLVSLFLQIYALEEFLFTIFLVGLWKEPAGNTHI